MDLIRNLQGMGRLCLWRENSDCCIVWERLYRACNGNAVFRAIEKVERVTQRDLQRRYDIFMPKPLEGRLLHYINRIGHRWNWYCRRHRDRSVRASTSNANGHRGMRRESGTPVNSSMMEMYSNVRIGTFNVNGVNGKREDLRYLLRESRIGILGLQETLLTSTQWRLQINGYHCFQSLGHRGAARRGVALIVRDEMSANVIRIFLPHRLDLLSNAVHDSVPSLPMWYIDAGHSHRC